MVTTDAASASGRKLTALCAKMSANTLIPSAGRELQGWSKYQMILAGARTARDYIVRQPKRGETHVSESAVLM